MRNTLETRVDASGAVTLGNQQTLTAPGDVTVEEVLVTENQEVAAGTVLLRLRARELERQLEDARIQQSIDEISYQRKQEVVQENLREVRRAEERLAESRQLLDQGYISEDEYERDRNALEQAQSALRTAQVDLQNSRNGTPEKAGGHGQSGGPTGRQQPCGPLRRRGAEHSDPGWRRYFPRRGTAYHRRPQPRSGGV